MKNVFIKSFLFWLPMPLIGVVNGTLRQFILLDYFSEILARQISSLTLIFFLAIYIKFIFKKLNIRNRSSARFAGLFWVVLTLFFEFGFGYFVFHNSMEFMIAEYNLMAGKMWILVLVSLSLLPVLYFNTEHRRK